MAGIYVHIPFCKSRCKYCDFYSTTLLSKRTMYVKALLCEWEEYKNRDMLWQHPKTLYFGGGTPSVLEPQAIKSIIHAIEPDDDAEITLEVNPGDLTRDNLRELCLIGVNRLSIGIQSFHNSLLQLIGRRHSAEDAKNVVRMAQEEGFNNISIDLIYGLPGETMEMWESDVAEAISLHPQHISAYCLTYEPDTILTHLRDTGEIRETYETILNDMFDYICSKLTTNSYTHYEVSNFALTGYHSRHNSSYWDFTPYLGLGAAAHSFDGEKRWWNPADLQLYIEQAQTHTLHREIEVLTAEQHRMEQIMLGLRTSKGIDCHLVEQDKTTSYLNNGFLRESSGHYIATQRGLHILNQIINNLV